MLMGSRTLRLNKLFHIVLTDVMTMISTMVHTAVVGCCGWCGLSFELLPFPHDRATSDHSPISIIGVVSLTKWMRMSTKACTSSYYRLCKVSYFCNLNSDRVRYQYACCYLNVHCYDIKTAM